LIFYGSFVRDRSPSGGDLLDDYGISNLILDVQSNKDKYITQKNKLTDEEKVTDL